MWSVLLTRIANRAGIPQDAAKGTARHSAMATGTTTTTKKTER